MPPPVPIPSSSARSQSRLEHVLASFEDNSSIGPSSLGNRRLHHAATLLSHGSPYPVDSSARNSGHQPRIVRASSSAQDSAPAPTSTSVGGRLSTSPIRHRSSTSRPPPRPSPATQRAQPQQPWTPPSYLQNALLSNLVHGGPPQAIVPEAAPTPVVIGGGSDLAPMSDSDESVPQVARSLSGVRRRHRDRGMNTTAATGMTLSPGAVEWPTMLPVPTQWSDTDKSNHLILSPNGRDVTFGHVSTLETQNAAAVRAECPIPPQVGVYYYEVTVMDRGVKGQISIGFATKDLPLSKLPGWEAGSWGYHGDDGLSFQGQPRSGSEFGPRFATDDTIGCGVNFLERNAFYTKNGVLIGSVFSNLPNRDLYPAIGLRTAHEHIRTNFGSEPFKYDIETHIADVKLKAWRDVQTGTQVLSRPSEDKQTYVLKTVDARKGSEGSRGILEGRERALRRQEESLQGVMADLVLDWLVYRGYGESARKFVEGIKARSHSIPPEPSTSTESMDVDSPPTHTPFSTMTHRAEISASILAGDIQQAHNLVNSYFPEALVVDGKILEFKLRCRRFVELILNAYDVKRKAGKEGEDAVDGAGGGGGAVAEEGANAMDLDDDFSTSTNTWGVNGASKGKGKATTRPRRRSSSSRPGRASSRTRSNGLLSPLPSSADSSAVIDAIQKVLDYGTKLSADWEGDERSWVKESLRRTVGLVAYEDPWERDREVVGEEGRVRLADEVNRVILATYTKSKIAELEKLYRHIGTVMHALGAADTGLGAYMDVGRIFEERL